jgi:hypothetical protein
MIVEEQFTEIELNVIYEALNTITVQGKNARMVADLIDKIAGGLMTIQNMKKDTNSVSSVGVDSKKTSQK